MRHRLAWYGIILCLWSSGFSQASESKPAWQAEWERTVKAAEEEGQLTVYIAGYGALIDSGVFQKAYPKIKVTSVTGSGTQLAPRIVAERRGEKYLADVYSGGGGSIYQNLYLGKMLDPLKPALILPEVIDPTKWWEGKQRYADREGRYIIVYEANVAAGASPAYNSNLINPKDYKSLWDFLNPKLKGKIVSPDLRRVRGSGPSFQYLYYHADLGPEFLRRFYVEMDVTLTADGRQAMDWLAGGKFALSMPTQGTYTVKAKAQGLPVDEFDPHHFKEGASISAAFGQLALMNRAPHPNAAKVFVNWLLSREGQSAFQRIISTPGEAKNSRRIDVPKDHIPAPERRLDGGKYFDPDEVGTRDVTPVTKLMDEVLAGRK
ncbi:MAG TPA: extracellular solute-binding protein [Candidatus Limnocylindria bacterium]|nr:extracellular solute-binding protein [Candidatus Limnocylindria bacterium]